MKRAYRTQLVAMAVAASAVPAAAQRPVAPHTRSVCVAIDVAHDTFSEQDRRAALLLVAKQFELAGRHVDGVDCAERYSLAHVRLGDIITVTLKGRGGAREGTARGMDDLPALYSQLVRALLTGSSVGALNVVDRTNVIDMQASPKRVHVDSFGYARLGYGFVLGNGTRSPAIGFGYRAEMDSFGLDVSFLNQQLPASSGMYGGSTGMAGSLLKLEGLYFMNARGNSSPYVGGGLSWGVTSASTSSPTGYSSWSGNGLQGELTAGYELPRASALRVFVQADAALPFYRTTGETMTYARTQPSIVNTGHRYTPSLVLSIGMGWQRQRR
jgi:hypothetical protein